MAVRVSDEERAALEKAAGGRSMNAYLRSLIFNSKAGTSVPAKSAARMRGKAPVKDWEALGRVLAALGRSGIPDALERLIAAQNRQGHGGRFSFRAAADPVALDARLLQACADIAAMRADLVKALGLQAKGGVSPS